LYRKPRFHIFKNTSYALSGIKEVFTNETPFRIEVFVALIMTIIALCLPISFIYQGALIASLGFVLVVEILNSAIERVVDLVTKEHHLLAKYAKDAASGAVFISIVTTSLIWVAIIVHTLF
jgi:diacylglycerol kinase (ATP)